MSVYSMDLAGILTMNKGKTPYIDYVSDEQISWFLDAGIQTISVDHPMIKTPDYLYRVAKLYLKGAKLYSKDIYLKPEEFLLETVKHLTKILSHIKILKAGRTLVPIKIDSDSDYNLSISEGWHKVRAYQYLHYEKIPYSFAKLS